NPSITLIYPLVREIFYRELPRPFSSLWDGLGALPYRLNSQAKIVAVSQSTARDLLHCGISKENIEVISPGCANPGLPRTSLKDRAPKTIGCVSRLMKYKGLQFSLKAFSEVVRRFLDAKLLIEGSGPYGQDLAKMSQDLGISKN